MALIDHSFKDFLNLHRLNFKNWKIVDVDHFMKGNPFFKKHVKDSEWKADFDNKMGPAEARNI